MPAILAVTGLGLLALGLSAHEGWIAAADPEMADRLLTSAGALTLAAAHLVNWRWRHRGRRHKLPSSPTPRPTASPRSCRAPISTPAPPFMKSSACRSSAILVGIACSKSARRSEEPQFLLKSLMR